MAQLVRFSPTLMSGTTISPSIEVYGTEGSLNVPDPNTFGGPVYLRKANDESWQEIPLTHGYTENSRGLGLADMVSALDKNRVHRASGELAYHILEVIEAFLQSSSEERHVLVKSTCSQPEPLTSSDYECWKKD